MPYFIPKSLARTRRRDRRLRMLVVIVVVTLSVWNVFQGLLAPTRIVSAAQDAPLTGRLGDARETFEAHWNLTSESESTIGEVQPVQTRYAIRGFGWVDVAYFDDIVMAVRLRSDRPSDANLSSPEKADWSTTEAANVALQFLPTDVTIDEDPQMSPSGLVTTCHSQALEEGISADMSTVLSLGNPGVCQFSLQQNREGGVHTIFVGLTQQRELLGPTGAPILAGETRPANTLVVLRLVDHTARTIDVSAVYLAQEMTFGPSGMISVDGWENYASWEAAYLGACGEAKARQGGSQTPGSWESGYVITLATGEIPRVCT